MVAAEIRSRAARIFGLRAPKEASRPGSHSGTMGLRRLEQGRLAVSQIFLSGLRIAL